MPGWLLRRLRKNGRKKAAMVRRHRAATKKAATPIMVALANMLGAIAGRLAAPEPYQPKHPPRRMRGRGHALPHRLDSRSHRRKAQGKAKQRRLRG